MKVICYFIINISLLVGLSACSEPLPAHVKLATKRVVDSKFTINSDFLLSSTLFNGAQYTDLKDNKIIYAWAPPLYKSMHEVYNTVLLADNDNKALTCSNHQVIMWDINTGKLINNWQFSTKIVHAKVTHSAKYIFLAFDDNLIELFDLKNGKSVWQVRYNDNIKHLDISATGLYAVVATGKHKIDIWDIPHNKRISSIKAAGPLVKCGISNNEKYLLYSTMFNPITLVHLKNGLEYKKLYEFNYWFMNIIGRHTIHVSSFLFDENDKILYTGTPPGKVHKWDVVTGKKIKKFEVPRKVGGSSMAGSILSLGLSADKKNVYALNSRGYIFNWSND